MEQIYTIPVNEAFDASAADRSLGCPVCALYNMLEDNELDLILGASMMEPDVRIRTNREGFCRTHYDMMFTRKNRLGMALTLQSHLNELRGETAAAAGTLFGDQGAKITKRIGELEQDCYVCSRIDFNFRHMLETIVLLWDSDENFSPKFTAQPYFCLPHYRMLLEYGRSRLNRKKYAGFVKAASGVVEPYFDKLRSDIDWFCKKFDYRFSDEPWLDSKDAVERAIKFLRSDIHRTPEKKK
jgi:hypothetical protein